MSRSHITKVEAQELEFWCPKCGAGSGVWCQRWSEDWDGPGRYQSKLTSYMPYLHRERFELATQAGLLPLR